MPHVNDARRRAGCAHLLGGPAKLERAARVGGCRVTDTSSLAQQEFQALLLWSLLSLQGAPGMGQRQGMVE